MKAKTIRITLPLFALSLFGLRVVADDAPPTGSPNSKTTLLVIGKALIADPPRKQKIAEAAVEKIAIAAKASDRGIDIDAVAEAVMTKQQYWQGEENEKVTGAIFKERVKQLAKTATRQDTVVIYTHSHGRKAGFEASQPLGGIVLDLPVRQGPHRGTMLWDEYVELLLDIPAKNVVVLTMSCFSGGLVEYLNSQRVKARWESRRKEVDRNLIVLTSQNCMLPSGPIMKEGEIINPFTFAVSKMLAGEADGFRLVNGKPDEASCKDGKLTVGEMIDYVLYTTQNATSEQTRLKNTAKPQLTGSFDRGDVLAFGAN